MGFDVVSIRSSRYKFKRRKFGTNHEELDFLYHFRLLVARFCCDVS